MKRTVLLLLACLLLALRTVAQAPEKATPDDLVVTAEIVGYSKQLKNGKEHYTLYARMVLRNNTTHPREINIWTCAWYNSWVVKDAKGNLEQTCVTGCDKNSLNTIAIPSGEAMIFNCPLFWVDARIINGKESSKATLFKMGFADLSYDDMRVFGAIDDINDVVKHARTVYWSSSITSEIDLSSIKEVPLSYPAVYLTWDDK